MHGNVTHYWQTNLLTNQNLSQWCQQVLKTMERQSQICSMILKNRGRNLDTMTTIMSEHFRILCSNTKIRSEGFLIIIDKYYTDAPVQTEHQFSAPHKSTAGFPTDSQVDKLSTTAEPMTPTGARRWMTSYQIAGFSWGLLRQILHVPWPKESPPSNSGGRPTWCQYPGPSNKRNGDGSGTPSAESRACHATPVSGIHRRNGKEGDQLSLGGGSFR